MVQWMAISCQSTQFGVDMNNCVVTVRETCRRQGYGEALIHAAVQQIRDRKLQCVNLHVDPTCSAAVALYKKNGFFVETTMKSY